MRRKMGKPCEPAENSFERSGHLPPYQIGHVVLGSYELHAELASARQKTVMRIIQAMGLGEQQI